MGGTKKSSISRWIFHPAIDLMKFIPFNRQRGSSSRSGEVTGGGSRSTHESPKSWGYAKLAGWLSSWKILLGFGSTPHDLRKPPEWYADTLFFPWITLGSLPGGEPFSRFSVAKNFCKHFSSFENINITFFSPDAVRTFDWLLGAGLSIPSSLCSVLFV